MIKNLAGILLLALGSLAAAVPSNGQVALRDSLSVEAIFGSDDFDDDRVRLRWMNDARHFTTVEYDDSAGVTHLVRVDARSGEREVLIRGTELRVLGRPRPVLIQDYAFAPNESRVLIQTDIERIWRYSTRGTYYVWDFETRRLFPIGSGRGVQQFAKFGPAGRRVAFVRDQNLHVTDLETGEERALTTDGGGDVLNGVGDWVYEEELQLYDAFRWSPDGRRIAFWRFDRGAIPPFYLVDEMPLYPELRPVRYPKAGTENSQVRIGVVELESGETSWIDLAPGQEGYVARMDFHATGEEIWIQRLNRHQNRMDLLLADVTTGQTRSLMTDTDEAWLDLEEPFWIDDGFVYLSERDGRARLYRYGQEGGEGRPVTPDSWDVLEVFGVDDREGVVYFTSNAEGPLQRPLYRIGLDGGNPTKISREPGTHDVSFNPDFSLYVDRYSRAGVPPVQTLNEPDGDRVRVLADNARLRERVRAAGIEPPEFLQVPSAEDGVQLNAYLIRPPDFDAGRRYPLLIYVYGGPGSQTVTDEWGGDRFLWHQLLARRGYLVASVDNRGTGARGARFKKQVYLRLGQLEVADQIAAARHFGRLPYVDGSRIGIWGWSYGGYMAAFTLLRGADVFRTAISVAPVTDWRLYDTIYTERYMRTPRENPQGYRAGSVLNHADRLAGHLLLVHGTGDDNVHPQNTMRLVNALEEANKQFDLRLYPNKAHGIRGRTTQVNLFGLLTSYVVENL